ncbi:hypothetical protein TWF481_000721 [Arthrobotrys musiformis]|uniref:T6SS Phospholipase effector Tle1-like catalytic domain-containing protein n=1 Tax=Arthrobotrys musiformis TaxID=47236 RepID=A0AAV9WNE0_9PEZI
MSVRRIVGILDGYYQVIEPNTKTDTDNDSLEDEPGSITPIPPGTKLVRRETGSSSEEGGHQKKPEPARKTPYLFSPENYTRTPDPRMDINHLTRASSETTPPPSVGGTTEPAGGTDDGIHSNGNNTGPNDNCEYTGANGHHSHDNDDPNYCHCKGVYINGNNSHPRTNGTGVASITGNNTSRSQSEEKEDIYSRPSALPRPVGGRAASGQRQRTPTASSAVPTADPHSQKQPAAKDTKIPRPAGTPRNIMPASAYRSISEVMMGNGNGRDGISDTATDTNGPTTEPPKNPSTTTNPTEACSPPEVPQGRINNTPATKAEDSRNEDSNRTHGQQDQRRSSQPRLGTQPLSDIEEEEGEGSKARPAPSAKANISRASSLESPNFKYEIPTRVDTDISGLVAPKTRNSNPTTDYPILSDSVAKALGPDADGIHQQICEERRQYFMERRAEMLSMTARGDRLHEYLELDDPRFESPKVSPVRFHPSVRPKKLILILDATNSRTVRPTPSETPFQENQIPRTVLKRISDCLAAKHEETGMRQQIFYLSGCGTGEEFGLNKSLHTTILDAYTYLSDNWEPGDELFLFGFSRGAFAIRAIAALITEVGLLNKAGMVYFEALYDAYFDPKYGKCRVTDDYAAWRNKYATLVKELGEKQDATVTQVSVKFLGCLETIGWSNYEDMPAKDGQDGKKLWEEGGAFDFRHLILHEAIENAFHALALDEDRISHSPLLMFRSAESVKPLSQVWFTGSHINIGGGRLTSDIAGDITPDKNELSDIVFLFMVTECHEFLSFDSSHVTNAGRGRFHVPCKEDSTNLNLGLSLDLNDQFKYGWVSSTIDKVGPDTSKINVFGRIINAAGNRKKPQVHVRTPLQYRPHWFTWEPWNKYKSCEAVHVSCKYRSRKYPDYTASALKNYRSRILERFGLVTSSGQSIPGEQPESRYNAPRTPMQEKFYFNGEDGVGHGLKLMNTDLPIVKLSAFEVLHCGGDALINAFGIGFRDLYRESPPVFRYDPDKLIPTGDDWIFRIETRPSRNSSRNSSYSVANNAPALRSVKSDPTSLKYQGYVIKSDSPYDSFGRSSGPPPAQRGSARTTLPRGSKRKSKRLVISEPLRRAPSPPRQTEPAAPAPTNPGRSNPENQSPFSYTSTIDIRPGREARPGLKDESGGGKGKGRHSGHAANEEEYSKSARLSGVRFAGLDGIEGPDQEESALEPEAEGASTMTNEHAIRERAETPPGITERKGKRGTIRKLFSFSSLRGGKRNSEGPKEPRGSNKLKKKKSRPGLGRITNLGHAQTDSSEDTHEAEREEREREEWAAQFDRYSLVLPPVENPDWRKQLHEGTIGETHRCKHPHLRHLHSRGSKESMRSRARDGDRGREGKSGDGSERGRKRNRAGGPAPARSWPWQ